MTLIKILLLGMVFQTQTSVYSLRVPGIDGSTIDFSAFHDKKILIINTAVNSDSVFQYGELEQLYQKYKDSLVIMYAPAPTLPGKLTAMKILMNL